MGSYGLYVPYNTNVENASWEYALLISLAANLDGRLQQQVIAKNIRISRLNAILLMAFVVVAVSGGIIWYNMKKLCGKNYRKLFQKQKK